MLLASFLPDLNPTKDMWEISEHSLLPPFYSFNYFPSVWQLAEKISPDRLRQTQKPCREMSFLSWTWTYSRLRLGCWFQKIWVEYFRICWSPGIYIYYSFSEWCEKQKTATEQLFCRADMPCWGQIRMARLGWEQEFAVGTGSLKPNSQRLVKDCFVWKSHKINKTWNTQFSSISQFSNFLCSFFS